MSLFWLASQSSGTATYGSGGGGSGPSSTFGDAVTALAPSVWLRLGESSGTAAADEMSVVGGTYVNAPTLGASGYANDDTAVALATASSQYVRLSDNAIWDVGTNDYSIHIAAALPSWNTTNYVTLFARGNGAGVGDYRLNLSPYVTNRVLLKMVGTEYSFDAGVTLAGSGFHAYGISVDRSANAVLYIDGVAVGTADVSAQSAVSIASSRQAGIGAEADPSLLNYLGGTVDEFVLWAGTAVSAADWSTLHAARNG